MKNSTQLRDFTNADWDAYSGCESDKPEIGTTDLIEVVLDGLSVCATVQYNFQSDIHVKSFRTEDEARGVAETLLEKPVLTHAILGESVGTC